MKQKLLQGITYLFVSLFAINCGEPVPVACTPDEEECTTEREGGFETGSVAGIAAGGAVLLALISSSSVSEEDTGTSGNSEISQLLPADISNAFFEISERGGFQKCN